MELNETGRAGTKIMKGAGIIGVKITEKMVP